MSVKYHEVQQRTDEWRRLRLGKITGTRLKEIFKSNNLPLVDELISERLTGRVDEIYVNDAMQRGIDMEPIGIEAYEKKAGVKVHEMGFVTNENYPECGLSPDGFIGSKGAIELKCPGSKKHIEYIRTNKLPAQYKYQVTMYFLMCEDLEYLDFVSFDPRVKIKPLHILRVNRDEIDLETARAELTKFCDKLTKYYDQVTF